MGVKNVWQHALFAFKLWHVMKLGEMRKVSKPAHVGLVARPAVVVGIVAVRKKILFLCLDGLKRCDGGR